MLKEFINDVILRNRPEHTPILTYTNYGGTVSQDGIYSDSAKEYGVRNCCEPSITMKSAKAFCAFIKEELSRRNNPTGKYATARIHSGGGNFIADCDTNKGKAAYERLNSEQYKILEAYNGQVLDHEEFLIMLQKLKPSIVDFAALYKKCSKIRMIGRSELTSTPLFDENGEAESGYVCTYRLSDGTDEDATLPAKFEAIIPFVKAGERKYCYQVELLFFNTKSSSIAVKVQVTNWETVEEEAIIDEANDIKNILSENSDLLVLADF